MESREHSGAIRPAPHEPRRQWSRPLIGDGHVVRRADGDAWHGAALAVGEHRARRPHVADQRRRPGFQRPAGRDPGTAAAPFRHAGPTRSGVSLLAPPDPAAKPVVSEELPALDRLFVTIAALDDTFGPAERIKTIYPRYFDFGRF